MFQELMPLLRQRTLVLTVSWVNADEVCVNVIPQRLKSAEKDDNDVLTTPLSLTGTAAELDQELPKQLVEFVGAHVELASTLKNAKAQMDAAAKASKDAVKKTASAKPGAASPKLQAPSASQEPTETTTPSDDSAPAAASASDETTGNLFTLGAEVES